MIIYEWSDVPYLGVDTPDDSVGGSGLVSWLLQMQDGADEAENVHMHDIGRSVM